MSSGPSSSQSSASRSSTRRAYDAGHSSSGAPGFLAGLAVVAGGVESESDGNASHLAACIEAHGSSAPFTASSSMPGIAVTAMYSGDPVRGHAFGAFVCCCLGKPLNLLERCDPVGDPDGLPNMCCCKCGDKQGLPQFGRNGFRARRRCVWWRLVTRPPKLRQNTRSVYDHVCRWPLDGRDDREEMRRRRQGVQYAETLAK